MFSSILISTLVLVAMAVIVVLTAVFLRRVVPTNMVHIVQSSKSTTPYGRGKEAGNTYYAWPSWIPRIGISVIEFPESIFQISLSGYDAYDTKRLPFVVDVAAFFRVEDANTVAQRVESFNQLREQLQNVLQGAVRRILATNTLEQIMEARSELGEQFTAEVTSQIAQWGVHPVKTIEFMDIRDSKNSEVIADIMAKEKSRIEMESRTVIAQNSQTAQLAEINAQRTVDVQKQDAEQQVGIRTAEKEKTVGIAQEQSVQQIQEQARETAERTMAVRAVEQQRTAEIAKNVMITQSEAEKEAATLAAEANLITTLRNAEGIKAEGDANASAETQMLMAPVTAQLALAKEIGSNGEYQHYLVRVEEIKASSSVGYKMADALAAADLKIFSTGNGDNVAKTAGGLLDVFGPVGGTKLSGLLTALSATPEGKMLVNRITGSEPGATIDAPDAP